jgi:hypothetical protein
MSTLTPTQYQAYQNRSNQPDLLDAANDTALADMRARIDRLEDAMCRIVEISGTKEEDALFRVRLLSLSALNESPQWNPGPK